MFISVKIDGTFTKKLIFHPFYHKNVLNFVKNYV